MKKILSSVAFILTFIFSSLPTLASEADLIVPNFKDDPFNYNLLLVGIGVAILGAIFGLIEFAKERHMFESYDFIIVSVRRDNNKTIIIVKGKIAFLNFIFNK